MKQLFSYASGIVLLAGACCYADGLETMINQVEPPEYTASSEVINLENSIYELKTRIIESTLKGVSYGREFDKIRNNLDSTAESRLSALKAKVENDNFPGKEELLGRMNKIKFPKKEVAAEKDRYVPSSSPSRYTQTRSSDSSRSYSPSRSSGFSNPTRSSGFSNPTAGSGFGMRD